MRREPQTPQVHAKGSLSLVEPCAASPVAPCRPPPMRLSWAKYSILSLMMLVTLACTPVGGSGQRVPGVERTDYWGGVRARYRSETLEQVGPLMEAWLSRWDQARDDDAALDDMVRDFAENGVLVLNSVPFSGRDRIREALARRRGGAVAQGLSDFDVRGDMAFALARSRLVGGAASDSPTERLGYLVWVFVKEGSDWKIRSLVLDVAH